MENTDPGRGRTLRCTAGVWQLVDDASPEAGLADEAALFQLRQARRIAELEADNRLLRAAEERACFRQAEAEHRLKNTFAAVGALAAQTRRHSGRGDAFHDAFGARLDALARSHDLMTSEHRGETALAEVVGRCLEPYGGEEGRIIASGPPVPLAAEIVPALGLAFHELATNAAKHGALAAAGGRVAVTWRWEPRRKDQAHSVKIIWRERGGPPVRLPERRGFGSHLLERGLAHQTGGTAQLDFAPHGLDCHIWLPVAGRSGAGRAGRSEAASAPSGAAAD